MQLTEGEPISLHTLLLAHRLKLVKASLGGKPQRVGHERLRKVTRRQQKRI